MTIEQTSVLTLEQEIENESNCKRSLQYVLQFGIDSNGYQSID